MFIENPTEATPPECSWHNHSTFSALIPLKLTSIFKEAPGASANLT